MIQNEIEQLLSNEKWYPARKLILQEIKINPTNVDLWEKLYQTYFEQKYYAEALEISSYLYLMQPANLKYKSNYHLLLAQKDKFKQTTFDFPTLLNLPDVTVAVCLIFKDNINTLQEWYERVRNKFNQIIVVDTGSTDGSAEIFKDKEDITYIKYEWDYNFANARNVAYSYVKSDWVLWIDSDEWLEELYPQKNGTQFVANYYATLDNSVIITIDNANEVNGVWQSFLGIPRMHKAGKFNYRGAIHETIAPIDTTTNFEYVDSGIKLLHFGYNNDFVNRNEKMKRNIKLLEEALKNGDDDPRTLFYLGREHKVIGEYEKSEKYLLLAAEKANQKNANKVLIDVYRQLAMLLIIQKNYEETIAICEKGLAIEPDFPDFIYIRNVAKHELIIMQLNEIYESTRQLKEIFLEKRFSVPPDESIFDWRSDKLRADILRFSGYLAESKLILKDIHQKYPSLTFEEDFKFLEEQRIQLIKDEHDK